MSVKLSGQASEQTLASINQLWAQMDHTGPIARMFIDQLLQGKYTEFVRQASLLALFSAVAIFITNLRLTNFRQHLLNPGSFDLGRVFHRLGKTAERIFHRFTVQPGPA